MNATEKPELLVRAIPEIGRKWSAEVTEDDGRVVAGCSHRHMTRNAALVCGGRMAREVVLHRAKASA
jgi:hypothetical protein